MHTPQESRSQPRQGIQVLLGMSLMTIVLFGVWSMGPRLDYIHENYRSDSRFFSPAYSQKLFHVQSLYSESASGGFQSISQLTSVDVESGTIRALGSVASQYLVNRQGDVLAVRDRHVILYEGKSLRPVLTRTLNRFDTPVFLSRHRLLIQRGQTPQRPVLIDLDQPEKEPFDLTALTWGENSRHWPDRFYAHALSDDRFALFSVDSSVLRKNWLYLFATTDGGIEKLAQWKVAYNQQSHDRSNFQVLGNEIATTTDYQNTLELHSLETGELVTDSLMPSSGQYVFPRHERLSKGEASLKFHDGRSNHIINLDQFGQRRDKLYDLATNSWIESKRSRIVLDERPATRDREAAINSKRFILTKADESSLEVANIQGEVISTCKFASPIAYAAFLNDHSFYVVVKDILFGYQVQIVDASSGNCLRTIRPLMFWRLLLIAMSSCTLFVAVGWLSYFSKMHSMAWIDSIGLGCLFLVGVLLREYQLFSRVEWAHVMFRCLIMTLLASLTAIAVSRLVFGRGRLSNKLLAVEIFHLLAYYIARDVGFREADILGKIGEWLLFFLCLFVVGFVMRSIGFQGVRVSSNGTDYSGNQFGVREIFVVMVSVVIFLLLAKPNAERMRDWLGLVRDMRLVWAGLLTSIVALMCGYTRWHIVIKLVFILSAIIGSVSIAFFSQARQWMRWGAWYSMSEMEFLVFFSSLGILTWLMVLPFSHRGWLIVFRPKRATFREGEAPSEP